MTVSLRNAGFRTAAHEKERVPGVIKTIEDAATNTHPQPILYTPGFFVAVCVNCEMREISPRRATLAAALYDRLIHSRTHGGN